MLFYEDLRVKIMVCTFFGHRDAPQEAETMLRKTIIDLVEHHGANTFYVGNQGAFDCMVRKVLKEMKTVYPYITYFAVLAYMPGVWNARDDFDYSDTIYPDGLENTPKKFAVSKRNYWMIDRSNTVIVYVKYPVGGAFQFKELAEKKGKWIINIVDAK